MVEDLIKAMIKIQKSARIDSINFNEVTQLHWNDLFWSSLSDEVLLKS